MRTRRTKSDRTLIGITPDFDPAEKIPVRAPGEGTLYLKDRYVRAFTDLGAVPVILPLLAKPGLIEGMLERLDGVVISGGGFDIHPRHYGEEPIVPLHSIKENRTDFEFELLRRALRRDLPVLGICGGMQAINVAFAGSLYQDLASQRPESLPHQQEAPKTQPSHSVTVTAGTLLARVLGRKSRERVLQVNSTHHQAVKELGRGLVVNARSEDGLVEAMASARHRFVLGVQWHPEVMVPEYPEQVRLFRAFVAAALI